MPYYECRGANVEVESEVDIDIDPVLLDLGWSSADGFSEYSAPVSLTGELDGDELHVVEVRRRGEPVTEIRPDAATVFTVSPGEEDLCDRLADTVFGRPPPDDTYVDVDGTVRASVDWEFGDTFVTEFSGDVQLESTWSCFGNQVRWFGTRYEARLAAQDGLLTLRAPDGFEWVEYR